MSKLSKDWNPPAHTLEAIAKSYPPGWEDKIKATQRDESPITNPTGYQGDNCCSL